MSVDLKPAELLIHKLESLEWQPIPNAHTTYRNIVDLAKAMQEVADSGRRLIEDPQIAGFFKTERLRQHLATLDQITERMR